jgi:hypothetical protein
VSLVDFGSSGIYILGEGCTVVSGCIRVWDHVDGTERRGAKLRFALRPRWMSTLGSRALLDERAACDLAGGALHVMQDVTPNPDVDVRRAQS